METILSGGRNQDMKSRKPTGAQQQRYCELCGAYVGAMSSRDWELEGRICKTCVEAYASSLEIEVDSANRSWKAKGLSREKDGEGL
jgi:hypothetical protein